MGDAGEEEKRREEKRREEKRVTVNRWRKNKEILKQEIDTFLDSILVTGGSVAVWGAGHQGFTLIATLDMASKIEYIIDSAPFKQGKYAPASHVPIVAPTHFEKNPVQAIIIVAPGYTEEIIRIIRKQYGKDVKIAFLRTNHLEIFSE